MDNPIEKDRLLGRQGCLCFIERCIEYEQCRNQFRIIGVTRPLKKLIEAHKAASTAQSSKLCKIAHTGGESFVITFSVLLTEKVPVMHVKGKYGSWRYG